MQFLGDKQLTVLSVLTQHKTLQVKDLVVEAPGLIGTSLNQLVDIIDPMIVQGYVTCSSENTLMSSWLRITYEGEQEYEKSRSTKPEVTFQPDSLLVFEKIEKALVEGAKVCFVTTVARRPATSKFFRERFGVSKDLAVISLGDSKIDWSTFKVPGMDDFTVYMEPSVVREVLGGALLFLKHNQTRRLAIGDGTRLRRVRKDRRETGRGR